MLKGKYPIDQFRTIQTPFYYYDIDILTKTLEVVVEESRKHDYLVHYAVKANANPRILSVIASYGLGADCVSGGEIKAAIEAGFPVDKIVFAGVGKADWEIEYGLEKDIACFNVESLAELLVINDIAFSKGKVANVFLRINPEVDAHTHAKITTGKKENKFGINLSMLDNVLSALKQLDYVHFSGLHFHIGSQITDISAFEDLAIRVNELQDKLEREGVKINNLNFGGGLGIDYYHPNHLAIPSFDRYFEIFSRLIHRREGQQLHFEPGRSIVGQCGTLITKVLYVKEGEGKQFAILDAGFTDLLRPAMYEAYHRIENLTSDGMPELYDVVGPICESSDVFAVGRELNKTSRNDLIAIRSAGAYGEVMASQYNFRSLPASYFSDAF